MVGQQSKRKATTPTTTTTTTTTTTASSSQQQQQQQQQSKRFKPLYHNQNDDDDDDDDETNNQNPADQNPGMIDKQQLETSCPYLDTIDRSRLDFDFEKVCSVSLNPHNVYCCLICGKYFQGRGRRSHAHFHSLQQNHHVFLNLISAKAYCLPEDYEIIDSSLDDIKAVLNPTFTLNQVRLFDKNVELSRCLDGTEYLPGIVGLNNIKSNDSLNVVLQSLIRVPPLRDFFIFESNYAECQSPLVKTFGELVRKLWHSKNFKAHVSPHEILQAIAAASKKRFRIGVQSDPIEFLSWLLNTLQSDLAVTKKNPNIIRQVFQGKIEVTSSSNDVTAPVLNIPAVTTPASEKDKGVTKISPFFFLSIDLPPPPLFQDEQQTNIIPQVPLFTCLRKFDPNTRQELPNGEWKKYKLIELPDYLIIQFKRFTKNNWFVEKNRTIVNFPIKNLEMKDWLAPGTIGTKYDLLTSIKHEGLPDQGTYSIFAQNKGSEKWYEIQDLRVEETMPQMIALSEAYLQIWERKKL